MSCELLRPLVDNELTPLILLIVQLFGWTINPRLCVLYSWIVLLFIQVVFHYCSTSATLGTRVMFGYTLLVLGATIAFGYLTGDYWVLLLTLMPLGTLFLNLSAVIVFARLYGSYSKI